MIARYHQHSAEQLDMRMTPLQYIKAQFPEKNLEDEQWRQVIGRFGLTGTTQVSPIGTLSGGQKSRIVFCVMAQRYPHMLLLDEPTNHLDMECIDALAESINEFEGGMYSTSLGKEGRRTNDILTGIVLVSHDFRLLAQVAKEIWVCDNKKITKWGGDILSYKNHLRATM